MSGRSTMNHFTVGPASVDALRNHISVRGQTRRIEPRVMKTLVRLSNEAGAVVTREELLDYAWEGAFVSDEALTKAISQLRKALEDRDPANRIIETVPKIGYRLAVAPAQTTPERFAPSQPALLWSSATRSRFKKGMWIGAATTILMVILIGVSYQTPAEDMRAKPTTFQRILKMPPGETIPNLTSLGISDSLLDTAHMVKVVKMECAETDDVSHGELKLYTNNAEVDCTPEGAWRTESHTIIRNESNTVSVQDLIADVLR